MTWAEVFSKSVMPFVSRDELVLRPGHARRGHLRTDQDLINRSTRWRASRPIVESTRWRRRACVAIARLTAAAHRTSASLHAFELVLPASCGRWRVTASEQSVDANAVITFSVANTRTWRLTLFKVALLP